jgi:ubiquitin-conjugating enzyme E2 variant
VNVEQTNYGYSRSHRVVEILSIILVFGLLIWLGVRVALTIDTAAGWVFLAITGMVGYLMSDFISGFVHWAGDTIGDESLPFVGKNFIVPFREHHIDPKDIARHDFVETNGNNCIIALVPLSTAFLILPGKVGYLFFGCALMGFLALFVVATNQFHKWAHSDHPPRVAVWLQDLRLILSPVHHNVHHALPHDRHYCITVGWMNPILNGMRFFRAAEWMVARVRPSLLHIEERKLLAAMTAVASEAAAGAGAGANHADPRRVP